MEQVQVQGIGIESYPLRRYLLDRARGRARDYEPFIYALNISVAALNTDTAGVVNIDTDAPFLLLGTVAQYRNGITNAITGPPNGTALLRYGGSGGRTMTRTACAIHHLYPERGSFNLLPAAYPVEAGSQLHVTLRMAQFPGGGGPVDAWLLHFGLKLHGYGRR